MPYTDPRTGYIYIYIKKIKRLQHRVIMENHIERKLLRSEHVHHKNGIKGDNRIENLEIMTAKEHMKHHHYHISWGKRGESYCSKCKSNKFKCKSHGICSNCYELGRPKRKDNRKKRQPYPWGSMGFIVCIECKTDNHPYMAKGLCKRCYGRQWNKNKKNKS